METKFECNCGKSFLSVRALSGHARWCSAGSKIVDEREDANQIAESACSSKNLETTRINSSTTNRVEEEGGEQNLENGKSIDDDDESISVSYRCTSCYVLFPSIDTFRRHYLIEHLGIDDGNGSGLENRNDDEVGAVENSNETAEKDEHVQEQRSFCKRCRARILSSSEDEEEAVATRPSKKVNRIESGSESNEASLVKNESSDQTATSSTSLAAAQIKKEPADTTETSATSSKIVVESNNRSVSSRNCVGSPVASLFNARNAEGGSSSTIQSSADSSTSNPRCFAIVKELLKDANAISKPMKVLILSFISGQRVNPYPTKGPVVTIRLGEKTETVLADDGSEKAILRESYVKLNYDTGEWEKIEKTKQLLNSDAVSSPDI